MIINTDWFGESCPEVTFSLDQDIDIHFSANIPKSNCDQSNAIVGQYTEGLWEYDVAELFIYNPQTEHYVEINIAPNGAWWLMSFDSPRQRSLTACIDESALSPEINNSELSWYCYVVIPSQLIHSLIGKGDYRYNICFILGDKPRYYLSSNKLNSIQPDFHRPQDFMTTL